MTIHFNIDCSAYKSYQDLIADCKTNIQVFSRIVNSQIYTSKDPEHRVSLIQIHNHFIDKTASKVATLIFNHFKDLFNTAQTSEKDLQPFITAIQQIQSHADGDENLQFEEKFIKFKELVKTLLLEPIFKDRL